MDWIDALVLAPIVELVAGFVLWPLSLSWAPDYHTAAPQYMVDRAVTNFRKGRISSNSHPTWGTALLVGGSFFVGFVLAVHFHSEILGVIAVMLFIAPIFGSSIHVGILGWHGSYDFSWREFPPELRRKWRIPKKMEYCIKCGMVESGEIINAEDPDAGVYA